MLLVEDSESLQRSLGAGLRRSSIELVQAHDGYRAQEHIDGGGYDVIVLNLMIPGIDGLTLLTRLRRRGDPTGVLVLSAKDRIEDRVIGLDLGPTTTSSNRSRSTSCSRGSTRWRAVEPQSRARARRR